jgi:hypothetical protein
VAAAETTRPRITEVKREEKRESMIESKRVAMKRTVGVGEALGAGNC